MRDQYLLLDKEKLRKLCEANMTHEEMAEMLYCSTSTIRKYIKLYGLQSRSRGCKPLTRYDVGGEMLTVAEIAKRAGLSESTIRNRIHRGWTGEKLLVDKKEAFRLGMEERRKRWY